MKNFSFFVLLMFSLLVNTGMNGAKVSRAVSQVSGSVVNASGEPISYATVVLLTADSSQIAGAVSGEDGCFVLSAIDGEYLLKVNCMGYADSERKIIVSGNQDMGKVVLSEAATKIDEVVVKAKLITREADRFVVNVSGSNLAIGKNTYEMIGVSPGVRTDDKGIKINGRSGTKVMIGDRILSMSNSELVDYLKSIPAENVQKIEVIPVAGADYDADSSGGIIKITLKKQRNDGIDGTLTLGGDTDYNRDTYGFYPSFRVNYQKSKWNLYATGSYKDADDVQLMNEKLNYFDTNNVNTSNVLSNITSDNTSSNYRFGLGAVYDLNDRHSFGGEMNYYNRDNVSKTLGKSRLDNITPLFYTMNNSDYLEKSNGETMNGTLNYVMKLDTLGSTFKLIGDYSQSLPDATNLYLNSAVSSLTPAVTDKTFKQSILDADYKILAVTANVEKKYRNNSSIRFGGKYTYNTVFSDMKYYKSLTESPYDWVYDVASTNPATDYSEHIGALYFIYNKTLGKFSLSAGLRGEYTELRNVSGDVHQSYFGLFPNTTLSYNLNEDGSNILIGQYSRTVQRPSFSHLNADRSQLSEYSYLVGNPDLKPQYADNVTMTYVFNSKYSFSLVGSFVHDVIMQQLFTTPGSDIVYYQYTNVAKQSLVGLVASLPLDIAKWWSVSLDIQGFFMHNEGVDTKNNLWFAQPSFQTNITLPHNFIFEVSGWYVTNVKFGNLEQLPEGQLDVALKKRMCDNKITLSLGANNVLNSTHHVNSTGVGFTEKLMNWQHNPVIKASVSYNFKAGKKFNRRTVETGASDEKSRM